MRETLWSALTLGIAHHGVRQAALQRHQQSQAQSEILLPEVRHFSEPFDLPQHPGPRRGAHLHRSCAALQVHDLSLHNDKLIGCSFNNSFVGVWVVDLLRVKPFSARAAEKGGQRGSGGLPGRMAAGEGHLMATDCGSLVCGRELQAAICSCQVALHVLCRSAQFSGFILVSL